MKIAIIGLGLIGGSIAKSVKNFSSEHLISAFDKPEILDAAFNQKVIDQKLSAVEDSLDSDLIFLSLPVDVSISVFQKLADKLSPGQIITDVCGVKTIFQEIWESKKRVGYYIGGHPMTGKEKGGFENSDPLLFENSIYILSENAAGLPIIDFFTEIIHKLGAKITFLHPKLHDIIVASVSHLPQLVSVSLINSANFKESSINFFDYAAGGFRDMTRIAASDFKIWEPVLRENKKNIVQAIENFILDLESLKKSVLKEDYKKISDKFESARVKRDEIPKSNKGFLTQIFDLFIFVKDEPGVISRMSTALFEQNINIKDLELLKVRAGTGGTFRISFESRQEAERAKSVLASSGFKASF